MKTHIQYHTAKFNLIWLMWVNINFTYTMYINNSAFIKNICYQVMSCYNIVTYTGVDRWGTERDAFPPLFNVGDNIGIFPHHFSAQKHCEAYSLTHHSSLLKAAIQD